MNDEKPLANVLQNIPIGPHAEVAIYPLLKFPALRAFWIP